MNRYLWILLLLGIALLGTAVMGLLTRQIHTRCYAPGPLPTIGDIQSKCVAEYPAPRNRTHVGIGEQVFCWIDSATWHDTDICIDADGKQSEVSDTLGMIVWTVNGPGTVCPLVTYDSSPTVLTVDLESHNATATVVATVTDSGMLGKDPPIQRRKVFNIITPGGSRVLQVPVRVSVKKGRHSK
jgi:hypothetical protein